MARNQTRRVNRPGIATFLAFVVVLFFACNKDNEQPPVTVPADCQQFLNKYFDAWRSKDLATLKAVSYYLSPEERSRLPAGSVEMWQQGKKQLVAENFERITRDFGDFESYQVVRVKTTTISPQDQPAANMMGSGIHTEVFCKANFSKKHHAQFSLHLIKETEASQYVVAAWNVQASLID